MALGVDGRNQEALAVADRADAIALENPWLYCGRQNANYALGRGEPTIRDIQYQLPLYDRLPADADSALRDTLRLSMQSWLAQLKGAFGDALVVDIELQRRSGFTYDAVGWLITASDSARNHDVRAARELLAGHPTTDVREAIRNTVVNNYVLPPHVAVAFEENDPAGAARELQIADQEAERFGRLEDLRRSLIWPWLAYALAASGNLDDAAALIAKTPLDCTLCLQMRGRVAELTGDDREAERWFAAAAADAPSMPFALTDWGAMLMRRGDHAAAIEKFQQANAAGPHFADPLELWGETLLLDGHADLAHAKFEEASTYAPQWGRLHLKWAEALDRLGRKEEAHAQYRLAASLHLNPAEKADLAASLPGETPPSPAEGSQGVHAAEAAPKLP
jgi:tetratricopeptide (TPR) repeat protein